MKIIGQQGARKICQFFYIFKSSNIHLKQLGMLVCAIFGLQAVMCLVTFCRQHLPGSLEVAHVVSIPDADVTGF